MKGFLTLVSLSLYLGLTGAAPSPDVAQCSAASLVCCQSLESSSTPSVALILGLLGIPAPNPPVLVGITCTPVSIIGLGGTQCNGVLACCDNFSQFNGLIAFPCAPVTIVK